MSEANPRASIRNARETDEPQLLELLFRAFGRWPAFEIPATASEHFRWKMRSDPIAVRHQWVVEIDGGIAATMLRIIRRVRVRGRDCLARDDVDTAVDPHYQERGLYGALLDHALGSSLDSEFAIGFWYSTNPRTLRRSKPRRSKSVGNPIQVLEKPYGARAIVARHHRKYGGRLPTPLAVLRIKLPTALNRLRHRPYLRSAKRSWSVTTLQRFDDRIEGFFQEASLPFDFLIVRGRDYMNWRYCDPDAGRFRIGVAEQDGGMLGYLVFKITEGTGYIVDLLALPGRSDVVRSLVEDALQLFREEGVELARCWMISRHPYNPILRRYGFIDSRRVVGFRYRAVSLDESELEFMADPGARIHLTHGDSDWV